ncbi:MAG: photosystem II reaction center PsbP [Cyanobacteria bacterium J069]|nr:MAG: photosystem II oxygen evolving complex protein PsbP [Cyanobacteria bacterium J069]
MLKRWIIMVLVVIGLSTQGCTSITAALDRYVDSAEGYEFLYLNSWVPVTVKDGPQLVLHDLIETTENVSVIINPVPDGKTLEDLGTPSEVGYKLWKNALLPNPVGRRAELISAESHDVNGQTYYLLEFAVDAPDLQRHNLASVAVRRGKLYTFNLSTTGRRWAQAEPTFRMIVDSFSVS